MGLFDFLKKDKVQSNELALKRDEDTESNSKIGAGIALDSSIRNSIAQAQDKYYKPEYNPQTRKQFYDDGSAHKRVIDNTFAGEQTVKDPYSGAELVKKQRDAKIKYGKDWQSHAAEADHIDPLSQIVKRMKKNPFLTTDDIREIANHDDNMQVISRKLNQGSKDIGKGGSSQREWAKDKKRMEGVTANSESGESVEEMKTKIADTGASAERKNNMKAVQKSVENVVGTAHSAGTAGAQNSGVTALTMSGIMNVVSVIKGEKSGEDAVVDTIKDGGKAAATGYVMGSSLTVISHIFANFDSKLIQALAKNNVPGKIITAISVTGDTLKKWGNGEITTQECLIQLGSKGVNMATMGYSMALGQTLIPIPIVGGAIGALVGSMLTSNLYNNMINDLKTKQLEHKERMRIIAECNVLAEQAKAFRAELELYLEKYFQEYRTYFDSALSSMRLAYEIGDADGVIVRANDIARKLGGEVKFETVSEFKSFLDNDDDDIL